MWFKGLMYLLFSQALETLLISCGWEWRQQNFTHHYTAILKKQYYLWYKGGKLWKNLTLWFRAMNIKFSWRARQIFIQMRNSATGALCTFKLKGNVEKKITQNITFSSSMKASLHLNKEKIILKNSSSFEPPYSLTRISILSLHFFAN